MHKPQFSHTTSATFLLQKGLFYVGEKYIIAPKKDFFTWKMYNLYKKDFFTWEESS